MTDTTTDTLVDYVTETSKTDNETMKFFQKTFKEISDMDIRKTFNKNGENMFEPYKQIFNNYKNNLIPNNLKRINCLREKINNPNQIEELNECEKLDKESLKIIDEILDIFKNIMEHRLNKARISTLEGLSRDIINKHNIEARNKIEEAVLAQEYSKGGLRKSRKRKNNKKYTKNRTYAISKKYVSKKNKTRKIKKKYL
jgi:hypothetical protein